MSDHKLNSLELTTGTRFEPEDLDSPWYTPSFGLWGTVLESACGFEGESFWTSEEIAHCDIPACGGSWVNPAWGYAPVKGYVKQNYLGLSQVWKAKARGWLTWNELKGANTE